MIAFTICSNNYLAYAGVLAASLKANNPAYTFVLGLVDEISPAVDYARYPFDEVVPVRAMGIPGFERLVEQYNIIELNTAVKPFIFHHLFEAHPSALHVLYLDPDIEVFSDFGVLHRAFESASVLLVPHFSTPHDGQSGIITDERKILQRGLYNLGFMGLKNTPVARRMVGWWSHRLLEYGFINPAKGMFTDQKWIDLVPLYFDEVSILKKSGCDVAYWNLYENRLELAGETVLVNGAPMVFYHFSAFKVNQAAFVEQLAARFDPQTAAAVRHLYERYRRHLLAQDYRTSMRIPYAYANRTPVLASVRRRVKSSLARRLLD